VPFKSIVLTGSTAFNKTNGRLSRKFNLASGDTTAALGLAFLPGFSMTVYNTKYPIQYCYIDLDELTVVLQSWYLECVQKVFSTTTQVTSNFDAMLPFKYTAEQFRIAVAECIRGNFMTPQGMSQFMTYTSNVNGFEPLRMGTNCCGRNRYQMKMPSLVVENLRMLLPKFFDLPTKFANAKNQLVVVPVWGIYRANVEFAYNGTDLLLDPTTNTLTPQDLFALPNGDDPNVIDGTDPKGNVCDLNCSITSALIQEWNDRITALTTVSGPTAYAGGNSNASVLLQTRFAVYQAVDVNITKFTPYRRKHIPRAFIHKKKIERTVSFGKVKTGTKDTNSVKEEYEERYVPPDSSLFTQITQSFSSLPAITEDYKLLTNYLIYPTIIIETTTPPTAKQVRTGVVQSHILDWDVAANQAASSRGLKLIELGKLCVPGEAAGVMDELLAVMKKQSEAAQGGFIGDILSTLARELPV